MTATVDWVVSIDTLAGYLLYRSLLPTATLVDSLGFTAEDRTRRNRSFLVRPGDGTDLLVKQAGNRFDADAVDTLTTEAELLRTVATDPHFATLRWFSPRFVDFDDDHAVLVTELVSPATSLTKFHVNAGTVTFDDDAAATCGRILATFHERMTTGLARGYLPPLPERPPFALGLLDMARAAATGNPVIAHVVTLAEASGVYDRADEACALWAARRDVVHCDVRWDNMLLTSGAAPGGNMNLRLIDWELAAIGDAAWDVACYLGEYVRLWATTAGVLTDDPSGEPRAAFDLADTHASVATFLATYRTRRRLGPRAWADTLGRVATYLPFVLALAAYEASQRTNEVPLNARLGLRLAGEAAADPVGRTREWFGETAVVT